MEPVPSTPELSLKTGEFTGASAAQVPSLASPSPLAQDVPVVQDHIRPSENEPNVDTAYRWAQLYKNDVEYERFFDWIGRRSNPERTDFKQILDSIPLNWGPESLPPPLRRYFLKRFSGG